MPSGTLTYAKWHCASHWRPASASSQGREEVTDGTCPALAEQDAPTTGRSGLTLVAGQPSDCMAPRIPRARALGRARSGRPNPSIHPVEGPTPVRRRPATGVLMAEIAQYGPEAEIDAREIHKVPDPFPLTLAGMLAMVGPQAVNFGISIGGGEAYLLPNVAARGTLGMHWLMLVSVVIETALVYECIKYSVCTGRSFFSATSELKPFGFWPWFWAVAAVLTYAWPAWMGGAIVAAQRFTGLSTQSILPGSTLPPQYIWAVIALALVLIVFYFSDRTWVFLEKFFTIIMVANIVLVFLVTVVAARPEHYWTVLMGYLGITFLTQGYPQGLPLTDALALYNQPGGSLMWVSFWVVAAGWGMGRYAGQVTGVLRPPEKITAQELRWDDQDPAERAKMKQWAKAGAYSLILWWAV